MGKVRAIVLLAIGPAESMAIYGVRGAAVVTGPIKGMGLGMLELLRLLHKARLFLPFTGFSSIGCGIEVFADTGNGKGSGNRYGVSTGSCAGDGQGCGNGYDAEDGNGSGESITALPHGDGFGCGHAGGCGGGGYGWFHGDGMSASDP